MKAIITILLLLSATWLQAQNSQSVFRLNDATKSAIRMVEEQFSQDSINIEKEAKEKILSKRKTTDEKKADIIAKAEEKFTKEQEKFKQEKLKQAEAQYKQQKLQKKNKDNADNQNETVDSANVSTPIATTKNKTEEAENDSFNLVSKHKKESISLLEQVAGARTYPHLQIFIQKYLSADKDVMHYLPLLSEMDTISTQLEKLDHDSVKPFILFTQSLHCIKLAQETLAQPLDKQQRVKAQNQLKSLQFYLPEQHESEKIDSLREGLRLYYLTTSNMLDLIDEIKSAHATYVAVDATEESKKEAIDELKTSIDFEGRVDNFKYVDYMYKIYSNIKEEVVPCDEQGNYLFDQIKLDQLEKYKKELETARAE